MTKEIKITDSGIEGYSIEPKELILGRMYDNNADFKVDAEIEIEN